MNIRFFSVLFLLAALAAGAITGCSKDKDKSNPPGEVRWLEAYPASTTSITLRWTEVEGADGYNVYRVLPDTSTEFIAEVTGAVTYTHSNLEANTVYRYSVKVFNDDGEGSSSGGVELARTAAPAAGLTPLQAYTLESGTTDITERTLAPAASHFFTVPANSSDFNLIFDGDNNVEIRFRKSDFSELFPRWINTQPVQCPSGALIIQVRGYRSSSEVKYRIARQ